MSDQIITVRGSVEADSIGFTLPHEHVFIHLTRFFPTQLLATDYQLLDESLAQSEIERFGLAAASWGAGTPCLVDVTTDDRMGRSPVLLRKMSEKLGLAIVMGCGRYREPWYEPEFARISTSELAERLLDEIEHGVDGVRPGIIGELGADHEYVSPAEERVLRAGARAHRQSGLAITLHARASHVGLEQLAVLREEGVDPSRVIVGHSDTVPEVDYHEAIARKGAWVQFDTVRGRYRVTVDQRIHYLVEARRRGFLEQILLSHDVCAQSHLRAFGGTGYDFLPGEFAAALREAGFGDDELQMLFVLNPRRALTVDA